MNYRKMLCDKEVIAVGDENSLADLYNKLRECALNCTKNRECEHFKRYVKVRSSELLRGYYLSAKKSSEVKIDLF